jgi:hypothetical protein
MKITNRFYLVLVLILTVSAVWMGCSEDEGGTPFVTYVRVTDPEASDSLLVAAGQGATIAIMGGNLKSVQEVWFNDREAVLVPTWVTNSTIIIRVPSVIPSDVTNTITLKFADGKQLTHTFEVAINPPTLNRLKSEYVNEGQTAVIYGDYFYAPVSVMFTGGVEGEVVEFTDTEIRVLVPEGAEPGPITVSSNFGETESEFWFHDNRNILAGFDRTLVNNQNYVWRGPDFVVASDPAIDNINGKFVRVNRGAQGAWPYMEVYGGPMEVGSDIIVETKNLPQGALLSPADYSLKFEVNTLETMSGINVRFYFGTASNATFGDARGATFFVWQANENTNGDWQTVTIPWAAVYEANNRFAYSEIGYGMYIYFHGPNPAIYNFAMDNIRVVPNTNN